MRRSAQQQWRQHRGHHVRQQHRDNKRCWRRIHQHHRRRRRRQITLADNLWLAPNVIPGQHGSTAIYILDSSDRVIKASIDNVWPMPRSFNSYAAGGVNYVYPSRLPPHGYYTPRMERPDFRH